MTFESLTSILSQSLDIHAPLITSRRTLPHFNSSPWFNKSLIKLKRQLKSSQLRWKKSNNTLHLEQFKLLRSSYRLSISHARSRYYVDEFSHLGTNSRSSFKLAFSILGKSIPKTLPDLQDSEICLLFSDYFQSKISTIISSLPTCIISTLNLPGHYSPYHRSIFTLPSPSIILSIFQSSKSFSPLDPITSDLLRFLSPHLINRIPYIWHSSLITSHIPNQMKTSQIIPILKKSSLIHLYLITTVLFHIYHPYLNYSNV